MSSYAHVTLSDAAADIEAVVLAPHFRSRRPLLPPLSARRPCTMKLYARSACGSLGGPMTFPRYPSRQPRPTAPHRPSRSPSPTRVPSSSQRPRRKIVPNTVLHAGKPPPSSTSSAIRITDSATRAPETSSPRRCFNVLPGRKLPEKRGGVPSAPVEDGRRPPRLPPETIGSVRQHAVRLPVLWVPR